MSDSDPSLEETIREISALFAKVYLRLSLAEKLPGQLDSPETKSDSCDCG
jgi:hypothetical protein